MRLCKLTINNYRSIKNLSLDCTPLLSLLGPNNHGKSNVLSVLEFGLSTSSKPAQEDFFIHRDSDADQLWVEMTFFELTDQERTTFKRYVLSDGTVCIRKTARLENGNIEIYYNGWIEQPEKEWLRAKNAGNYSTRDKINETPLSELVPQSGRITKAQVEEAQQKYIEDHHAELDFSRALETGPLLGQKNVGGGVLPEFYLIPAVRDLTEEIKIKTTNNYVRAIDDPRSSGNGRAGPAFHQSADAA